MVKKCDFCVTDNNRAHYVDPAGNLLCRDCYVAQKTDNYPTPRLQELLAVVKNAGELPEGEEFTALLCGTVNGEIKTYNATIRFYSLV